MTTTTATRSLRDEASRSLESPRWQRRAACRTIATAAFFPSGNYTRLAEEHAKDVCASCPVRVQCLAFAMEHGEPFGIWGGRTAEERRGLVAQAGEH